MMSASVNVGRLRGHTPFRDELRQTKIQNFSLTPFRDEDVARLDIAMHDPLSMRGAQGVRNLDAPLQQLCSLQRSAANTISKRLALQKFHHQVWLTLMLSNIVNGADIGVV